MSRHAINPGFFMSTAAEIARVCGYISDDQTVANYFGIDREKVETIRAKMRHSEPRRFNPDRSVYRNSSFGYTSHVTEEELAAMGSRRLNTAIQKMFRHFAEKHGIESDEARVLLLNTGVSL